MEVPASEKEEILTLLDTIQLSAERARRRVVVMDSRPAQPTSAAAIASANAHALELANKETRRHFEDDSEDVAASTAPIHQGNYTFGTASPAPRGAQDG